MNNNANRTNPFPGIRSFEIEEASLFFGREKQIKEVVRRVKEARFLALLGASGSGKSSLIKAGLIPEIFKEEGKENWRLILFRPGNNPIGNLTQAIYKTFKFDLIKDEEVLVEDDVFNKLTASTDGLVSIISDYNKKDFKKTLIIIDQFEELFRFEVIEQAECSFAKATQFVELFLKATVQSEVPIYVTITMRSDFLGDCTKFPGLPEAINDGDYLIPRLTKEEIRQVIVGPVEAYKGRISGQLVDRLLNDVGGDQDLLPILQHSLMRTWDYWQSSSISNQEINTTHYEAIGTMSKALSIHAEEIYSGLDSNGKLIAEKLLKILTDLGNDNRGTRRPTPLHEICFLVDAKEDEVIEVIDQFRSSGRAFLTPGYDLKISPDSIIDISHESIMRVWERLSEWVDEETKSAQLYKRLSKSAELFQDGKTSLWIPPDLDLALKWKEQGSPNFFRAKRYDPLFDRAMTFLEYSRKEYTLDVTRKEEKQKRELKRARRYTIFLGTASLVSIFFLLISLKFKFDSDISVKNAKIEEQRAKKESAEAAKQNKVAVIQKKIAEQQQQIAEQQKYLTEEQKEYAITQQQIAIEQKKYAIEQQMIAEKQTVIAEKKTIEAIEQKKNAFEQKQIADIERTKAEESERNTKRLRLLAIARSIAIQAFEVNKTIKDDLPSLLALQAYNFNKNNNGSENDPDIFKALSETTERNTVFREHKDIVRRVIYDNTGKLVASCSDDGIVIIRNIQNQENIQILKTNTKEQIGLRSLAFSHNGAFIAAGSTDGSVFIWDLSEKKESPLIISAHNIVVNDICFDVTDNVIVTASSDGTVKAISFKNSNSISTIITIEKTKINTVRINLNNILACGSENGEIKLFDLNKQESVPIQISFNGKAVRALEFSPDGKILAVGNSSGVVRCFDLKNSENKYTDLIGHTSGINDICFNSDNKTLASCSFDGTIRIWNYQKSKENPIVLSGHDAWVYGISFSTDGFGLASCSADKSVQLWIINSSKLAEKICKNVTRQLTIEEWNKYIGHDIKYEKICPENP